PQEVVAIEARHLGDSYFEFPKDESKGKRYERQVFLTDDALKICRKWAKRNPAGTIFRNMRGRPWTAYAFNNRFCKMEENLGFKFCMYAEPLAGKARTTSVRHNRGRCDRGS